jgi:diaminohydroxyphosphoribosylaminopyrimidine deaminase/5-amino-6-(5-phosphoribosylamino)uracil reductase
MLVAMGHDRGEIRPELSEAEKQAAMGRAVAAAARVRCDVSPRPWVGAVIEPGGFVGATQGRQGPHAEIVALRGADREARGATLVCTLEPCSHHGRTPPCADAIIDAGIARVVVGIEDPDPQVAGEGIRRLRDAGIEVEVGVRADDVTKQLAPYLKHRLTGRPYVVLKLAMSADGRTAAPDGSSRWITGEAARHDAHRLRAESDAVLVGAGTVRADDPQLTVRLPDWEGDQPLRVVLGHAPEAARVQPAIEMSGDLGEILDDLGKRDVVQLLVEGGADVAARFHREGLVDRYVLYLAPVLFGGDDARPVLAGPGAPTIHDVWRGRVVATTQLGDDLRIDLEPAAEVP